MRPPLRAGICLLSFIVLAGCSAINYFKYVGFGYQHENDISSAVRAFLARNPPAANIPSGKVYSGAYLEMLEKSGLLTQLPLRSGSPSRPYTDVRLTKRAEALARRDRWQRISTDLPPSYKVNVGSLRLTRIWTISPMFLGKFVRPRNMRCYAITFAVKLSLNRAGRDLVPMLRPNSKLFLSGGGTVELLEVDFTPSPSDAGKSINGHLFVCTRHGRWFVYSVGK